MKKILITGCNGFIGRHASRHFAAAGYAVCGIDVAGTPEAELSRFVQGSITPEALAELGEPFDAILHLAGPGTVSAANQDADALQKQVLNNVRNVLEITRKHPETLLLYPSSAAVYGDQPQDFMAETDPSLPLSQYGRNKVAEEALCEEYHRLYHSRVNVIRFFSIYGPGLRKQLLWDFSRRLAEAQAAGQRVVPCFGTGEELRDFIHVDDVVGIFDFCCRKNLDWLLVNAGTGTRRSVREVLTKLTAAYGGNWELDFDNVERPGNPFSLCADVRRLTQLGFQPAVPFEEGIARYARWAANELAITVKN